jgi:hypothetical protein
VTVDPASDPDWAWGAATAGKSGGRGGETTDRSIKRKDGGGYGDQDWQLAHRPQKVTSASSIA